MMDRPQDRAPRPPAALVMTTPEHLVAFGGGAGLSPVAPGTVGTVWGLPLFLLLSALSWPYYLATVAAITLFGIWVCGESARLLGIHDSPGIVFDEIAGFLVTAAPLAVLPVDAGMAGWLAVAFILFRCFDILKPWPIRWLDQHVHGGLGIMLDDIVAGLYAGGILLGLRLTLGA